MNKFIEWFKFHWQQRAFKISTACGLIVLYLEIVHHQEFNILIHNVFGNSAFITTIVGAVGTYLLGTKKF